ncbi:MAG: HIT domain-containing protein [Candidatus Norongarragalinales archaeon]
MNCVFCKIVSGEFDSAKIWEDGEFLAILDLNPNCKGMTLVMAKKHYDSYAFEMPDDAYARLMGACKTVGKLLDAKLGTVRTAMVMEGMGVNHVHVKLYPLHGIDHEFRSMEAKERVFFPEYPGYISTLLGPKAELKDLKKLAEEIRE